MEHVYYFFPFVINCVLDDGEPDPDVADDVGSVHAEYVLQSTVKSRPGKSK